MKRLLGLGATLALLTGLLGLGAGSAGAVAATTPVVGLTTTIDYPASTGSNVTVVLAHGLNLDGQASASAGGTPVTVCADGAAAFSNLQFGDIEVFTLLGGAQVAVKVFVGASAGCDGADPLIEQNLFLPIAPTGVLLVATAPEGGAPVLTSTLLNQTVSNCGPVAMASEPAAVLDPSNAQLIPVNATGLGTLTISFPGVNLPAQPVAFGGDLPLTGPPLTYNVDASIGGTSVFSTSEAIAACKITIVAIVGGQPVAAPPTPPTTPAPPTTTAPPAPGPAAAVAVRPAFTG